MADNALLFTKANPTTQEDEKALRFIEEITKNADLVQEKVLAEILNKNKGVEYLKRFNLDGATDRETFKLKIPVINYEDIHSDTKRIANGDRSAILSAHPISEFLTSSGTSGGERKLMPITEEELKFRQSFYDLIDPIMKLYVPDLNKGKGLYFMFIKSETRTPGGLLAQPALTQYYKSDHFKSQSFNYTSPIENILCLDSFQSMYSQILCGLLERHNVARIGTTFASGLVRAISFLQSNWQELVSDIMLGTLSMNITDSSVRNSIVKILKPNPELADFIRLECSKENWEGIIRRIWPNAKYLETIVTGSMAQYIPMLNYYSGCLPLVSNLYGSSECYFGLNLNPMCKPSEISYTIMPNMAYFEFLPLQASEPTSDSPSKLVDLADVEVGKDYEVVITNRAGLYRYRVGDILRVTGFYNSAPQFQFVRRKGALLSIDSDKTDEAELQKAMENASQLLQKYNTNVIEYTSYADTKTIPGHYVIFWELFTKDLATMPNDEVLSQCCLAMEESLSSVYRQGRVEAKSIGPLEIRVVKNGTFEELMNYAISKGSSISQYKVSRCVKSEPLLKILESRVLSSYFSPSLPHWTSERRFI